MVSEIYQMGLNETAEEYEMRVCTLGQENRLTWQEIAQIINAELGRNSDESTYRRHYRTYMMGMKAGAEYAEAPVQNTVAPEIEFSPKDEEVRERFMNATERLPYYRLMRQDSRFERFYVRIAEQLKQLPVPEYIGKPVDPDELEMQYVLGLADLHIGAKFEAQNNSYSIEEAIRRFEVLLGYMKKFIADKNISKLTVLHLGDLVQGILRISDLRLNEAPMIDAFVVAMRLIANFLNELSRYCYVDFKMVAYSNHDQMRPLGTKASELASEDLGKILYAYLCDTLTQNDRITIECDPQKDSLKFKIFDFNCKAMHGHQINSPNTICKDLANRDREFYDYIILGHTHSAKEIINAEGAHHNIQTLVLGSFVGSCPYADKLMVGSKASCSIYGFDKKYGHVESYTCILN